ncbi:MAG TPA: 30S ribosomal protein S6 [Chloroflexus aurantiacus]|jgi:small subunit ribosomal protein S6|uniref:Small ribosomal subunit protein bS6 n=1 Tax=Chloroflexus aurantiacus (strain ATCC 29366 / DSM 635 / J-10-fl) TaxID=324602 RepID=A9WIF5_CHLAA|nr:MULTISPECIES: 30S ribosomal protein S6 [Chloroflexus]ABY34255.1 ribosomal protein S6 [Chloroflexus aurantiacus J-10-fl]RMG50199.1 MAG: 30S ribosomal protein S6 [Chloroflexota bacterium]HBW68489.1 30S ribosomal protein S6 [Chloroflexus aurantiacus]
MSETSPEEDFVRERRREYELVVIINPLFANEEGITANIDRIRQTVEQLGGKINTVSQSSPWGRRKLAYPIREYVTGEASRRKFTEGYYVFFTLELSAAKVAELDRAIRLNDNILRHLLVLVEEKSVQVTPVEPAESETEEAPSEA